MNGLRLVPAGLAAIIALGSPAATEASCADSDRAAGAPVGYDKVQLVPSGVPSTLMSSFHAAYDAWNDPKCNQDGTSFPFFQTQAATNARVVSVTFNSGTNPFNSSSCANFAGNDINIYSRALIGTTWRSCTAPNEFQDTLSHELGHLLGLQDKGSACSGNIMSQKEVTTNGTYNDRKVQPEECAKVDETNTTPAEREKAGCASSTGPTTTGLRRITAALLDPCGDGSGDDGGGTGDGSDPTSNTGSPIIIDLDRAGFRLTSPTDGVLFDIDADGSPERIAWTASGSGDGFLALDRNENGWIDSGAELFGDHTAQPPSVEPHGFLALALYDEDHDGWITSADPVFPHLRVWVDRDRDGSSQPWELLALPEAFVRSISVEPVESRRRDEHGNEFRYSALVRLTWATTRAVDVFLRIE